jgi:hypothetical protein
MKHITLLFVALFVSMLAISQEKHSRILIESQYFKTDILGKAGIAVEEAYFDKNLGYVLEVSESETYKIAQALIPFKVMVDDLGDWYVNRNNEIKLVEDFDNQLQTNNIPVPNGFSLGSMGGYCTLDELYVHLDTMAARFPNLITSKAPITTYQTHEGREVYWVKISDNPAEDEEEPEVLFTGLTHAREPIGMQQLLFFMYHILENYETDSNIHKLLDTTELYFVPCVNPDGYEHNRATDPNGGGMWRKNMRDNLDGSFGVDLNRNFGYMWGYDDTGSSPYPSDMTYRGPSAFSEPETQMLRDFCQRQNIKITLNYHSYGNWFLYPWGYITDTTPDNQVFYNYGETMTAESNYAYGPASVMLYNTNGDANDWMYGDQALKPKIYSFVPEIGNGSDGFWPSTARIIPLCQENVLANFLTCYYAGWYAKVKDESNLVVEQDSGYFKYSLKRFGLKEGATYTVRLKPLDDSFTSLGLPKSYFNPGLVQPLHDSIAYTLKEGLPQGFRLRYIIEVFDGVFTRSDTITKIYGQPTEIFVDDCNSKTNWTSDKWDVSTFVYHSPTGSITDSKTGNYSSNANSSVTLVQDIDLSGEHAGAVLSFYTRWALEKGYDYVQVKASTNGSVWTALQGKYTHSGGSNQILGKPLYDGEQAAWVYEEIDLSNYLDSKFRIRFTLVADGNLNLDGYYFDDLKVSVFDNTTGVINVLNKPMFKILPNPAKDKVKLELLGFGQSPVHISVYDLGGRCIYQSTTSLHEVYIQVAQFETGVYLVKVESENHSPLVQKLVID